MLLSSVIAHMSPAPSSYWILGESSGTTATDQMGAKNGTYTGGYTLGQATLATGDPNTSVLFDGSSGRMYTANGTYLEGGTTSFTWWGVFQVISWSPASGNYSRFMGSDWWDGTHSTTGGPCIIIWTDGSGNHVEVGRCDPLGGQDFQSYDIPSSTSANTWTTSTTYDIAFTYDGHTMRLYVNGDLGTSKLSSTSIPAAPTTTAFSIGSAGSSGNPANIKAQHVAVWDGTCLSGPTIQMLHQARLGQTAAPEAPQVAIGAYTPTIQSDYTSMDTWSRTVGKPAAIFSSYHGLVGSNTGLDVSFARAIAQRGAVWQYTLEPWDPSGTANQPTYSCSNIAAGTIDSQLKDLAARFRSIPGPVLLRFAHEMNGNWYSWSTETGNPTGNTPAQYVSMWQHVWTVFQQQGVTNVRWVWCPNTYFPGSALLGSCYPGDAYVDYVGIDGYNWGNNTYNGTTFLWSTSYDVFSLTRTLLRQITQKPIMLCEMSCSESGATSGQTKAQWITEFFGQTLPAMPDIIAVIWFDINKEEDWRIASSVASQNAWSAGVAVPQYGGMLLQLQAGAQDALAVSMSRPDVLGADRAALTLAASPSWPDIF